MRYLLQNGPMQTTGMFTGITTGTSIKTMMQLKPGVNQVVKIVEWGCSFNGSSAATPGDVELIETDVAATVTAYVAADLSKHDSEALAAGDPTTSLVAVGTAASGYTATAEGSITTVRNLDASQFISGTTQYQKQFPLGREPVVQPSKFARIRVLFPAAVLMKCYLVIEL